MKPASSDSPDVVAQSEPPPSAAEGHPGQDASAAPALPFRNLVILTQYYAPEPGAPQIRLRAMVEELMRLGVRVRVITGMPNYPVGKIMEGYRGKLVMDDEIDGVPVKRLWLYPAMGPGKVGRLLNYLSFTAAALLAMGSVRARSTDLLFVEAQPITLGLAGYLVKTLRGIPYVYNTPDLQVEHAEEVGWLPSQRLINIARRLETFLMRKALSVTTVTHAFVEHFIQERGIPARKMSFLPNGADTSWLQPQPRDASLAQRLEVGERKVFTYAGTHAPYQRLEVIVEAARQLTHRSDIVILMVGKGPVRETLIGMAREAGLTNILFKDSPFEEMPQLMSITYAFLITLQDQPTAQKQRLSKTIPPLACGVPVIYAGHGESAEIITREGCGVRVEPERPDLLAAAIEALADDPDRCAALGRRGRALAVREFSWRTLVQSWVRQIDAIMDGGVPEIPGFDPALIQKERPPVEALQTTADE